MKQEQPHAIGTAVNISSVKYLALGYYRVGPFKILLGCVLQLILLSQLPKHKKNNL
jgi:hypothetical protein